jgi:CheY-like chemotaxis protein
MIATRTSLLALASSLDAQGDSLKAQAATIRAMLESAESHAPDAITLDVAMSLLGSKRRAREFFARGERAGFAVRRIGHAVMMDRAEWERAIEALATKRSP